MSSDSSGVYEQFNDFDQEAERLRSFELPTQVSIDAIGDIRPGMSVLDIGSGPNPNLGLSIEERGGLYIAFDQNKEFIEEQRARGALSVRGDALQLPFHDEVFDVTHTRFVLAHLSEAGRRQAVEEAHGVTKPGGRTVLIDYDWGGLAGSDVFRRWKAFTFEHVKLFDPFYGKKSYHEIFKILGNGVTLGEVRFMLNRQYDYRPAIALREVTVKTLQAQGEDETVIEEANRIFDDIEQEANQPDPPGFYMPDIVAIVARKH